MGMGKQDLLGSDGLPHVPRDREGPARPGALEGREEGGQEVQAVLPRPGQRHVGRDLRQSTQDEHPASHVTGR